MGRRSIIAALAANRVIGVRNALPWRLPADLRHFKVLTMGHHIIMGRRTWESLPGPLPGRPHVVVTRDAGFRAAGATVVHSIEEALAACGDDPEVFFVGGADLYRQALALANRLYLTEVRADYDGDAYFPELEPGRWRETERVVHPAAEEQPEFHFVVYERA